MGYVGDCIGEYQRVFKGGTRSLDYSSCNGNLFGKFIVMVVASFVVRETGLSADSRSQKPETPRRCFQDGL